MDKSLLETLCDNGLTEKEALVYITSLKLGPAPVSTIARHMQENRVTVYSILKNLATSGIAQSATKKNTTYYSVIDAETLQQKLQHKVNRLQQIVPELMALTSKLDTHVKTEFYEGFEGLKTIYEKLIYEADDHMAPGEPFLVIMGTREIDPKFQKYLEKDFIPRRVKFPRGAKAILSGGSTDYENYMTSHECIVIDDPLFNLANEIVLYGKDQVVIFMYSSSEMAALIVHSQTLYDALKAMFNMIWKMYHTLHPKAKKFAKKKAK